jgi:hypothetical protein
LNAVSVLEWISLAKSLLKLHLSLSVENASFMGAVSIFDANRYFRCCFRLQRIRDMHLEMDDFVTEERIFHCEQFPHEHRKKISGSWHKLDHCVTATVLACSRILTSGLLLHLGPSSSGVFPHLHAATPLRQRMHPISQRRKKKPLRFSMGIIWWLPLKLV